MDSKTLGFRIRQARERLEMSQEDLAAAVSKDQKAISEYENGKRKLAVTDLPAIATVLEVPITYFFRQEEEVYEFDDALLNYFHQLPTPEARRAMLHIMRILADVIRTEQT